MSQPAADGRDAPPSTAPAVLEGRCYFDLDGITADQVWIVDPVSNERAPVTVADLLRLLRAN